MELDFPGESSGLSLYFAPGFAAGYAALLADLEGPEEGEYAARLFAAHAFSDTFVYGISPNHWHPWPRAATLEHTRRTAAWGVACAN
ncbi:MAG: hypothetical protein ACE5I9_02415 [Candidatus Methylomirabilales bacterium]